MSEEEGSKEAFLDRWSRRKLDKAVDGASPPQKAEAQPPAPPLPPVEGLTPESDFRPFMASNVDGNTRRAALKRLFADAQFNVIDPFEPYSIDLTGEDPIPEEMLKTLNHAKRLLFDEKQQTAEAQAPGEAQASPQPQTEKTESDVAGKQDT